MKQMSAERKPLRKKRMEWLSARKKGMIRMKKKRKEETESEKPRPKKADPISEKAREPKLAFQFCHKDVRRKMT